MKKNKRLQKVTEIDNLKDIECFIDEHPNRASEVLPKLHEILNKSYAKKLGKENKATELAARCFELVGDNNAVEYLRNTTYEANHSLIGTSIHNFILDRRTFPTVSFIKEDTGLSRVTIYRHLKNGFSDSFNDIVKGKLEYLIPKALEKLYLIGVQQDSVSALKNFIELSGYAKDRKTTHINNFIQINNLKLSKDEFEQLPENVILEVEKIILENTKKN